MKERVLSIASYNVNGVRSFVKGLPLVELIKTLRDIDVLCLQETKISPGDTDTQHQLASSLMPGYEAFFSSCSARAGYSGVAVFAKVCPLLFFCCLV